MMFFLERGFRVVAQDAWGTGAQSQTDVGHDTDTYAADVAELVDSLDLRNSIHIGHSTGGDVVTRYVARHGAGRVVKAFSSAPYRQPSRNPPETQTASRKRWWMVSVTERLTSAQSSTRTSQCPSRLQSSGGDCL